MTDLNKLVEQMRPYREFTKLLKVSDIDSGALVPFVPNNIQRRLLNRITLAKTEGKPARLVILKARQMGMSTLIQSLLFHRAMINRGFKARTVAQQDANVAFLFNMTEGFYRNFPHAVTDLEPFQRRQHRSGMKLELENDSVLQVSTANTKTAGRGAHAQALHLSEVAFWHDEAEYTSLSLMQMVQEQVGTLIAMESTPNGRGGYFYDTYMRAKEGANDFEPVFEAWFEFAPYQRQAYDWDFNGQGEFKYVDDDEEIEANTFNLTPEQILWRRHKIENGCHGDVELFRQEFPSDDISCFLLSGRPYFTSVLINKWIPAKPILVGDMGKKPEASRDGHGPLHIYHLPEPGRKYVASIDPAGIQSDHQYKARKQDDKEDYSVIWVMRRHDKQTVAVYRDRVDPDVLAEKAIALAKYYNKALLAPEINGEGMVVLFHIKQLRYRKIYQRTQNETRYEPETDMQGWRTQVDNRDAILRQLFLLLRDAPDRLSDERLKHEMGSFVIIGGRGQAKTGEHDDTVLAAAIALQVAGEHPHALVLDDKGEPIKPKPQTYQGRVWDTPTTRSGLTPEFERKYPK